MRNKKSVKRFTPGQFYIIFCVVFSVVAVIYAFLMRYSGQIISKAPKTKVAQLDQIPIEQRVQFTDAQWQTYLTPLQFDVLRKQGTEQPFTGELLHNDKKGTYVTADCNEPVFRSEQKFDSHTGWPSFWAPIKTDAVVLREDDSFGTTRTEVLSPKCHSHLGHVFDDGPLPTGKRFCINSAALKFVPDP